MRVLMFGWEFPPFITGGLGTACYGLSQALIKLVDRLVFVLPRAPAGATAPFPADLEVVSAASFPVMAAGSGVLEIVPIDSHLVPYQDPTSFARLRQTHAQPGVAPPATILPRVATSQNGTTADPYAGDLLREVQRFAEQASRAADHDRFDVIHAHDWLTFPAGVAAKQRSGRPLVVHVHATEFDRSGERIDQRVYDLERMGMAAADRIIAVSFRTKHMIVERYGVPETKVSVVHNGVEPLTERPTEPGRPDERLVSFLGRITMQKGPEYFLEAAYLVAKAMPDCRFVMAGTGDLLPKMIERMAALGLVERCHFTGFLNEHWRHVLLSRTNVFVLTSVSEPFGISPVEAMQHGIPVIISRQSGVAEVVSGAIKVDFWDVRRMADAIINVLHHAPLRSELVNAGQRDLRALTWERAATLVTKVYQEVL